MAEEYKNEGIFQRLGKLFQNNIVVRKTPEGQLKVKDVDMSQTSLTSNFIERYNRLHGQSWSGARFAQAQNTRNAYDVVRKELFILRQRQWMVITMT